MVPLARHRQTKEAVNGYAEPKAPAPHLYSTLFPKVLQKSQAFRASFHFGRGGTRDFALRATKNVLTDLPAITRAEKCRIMRITFR